MIEFNERAALHTGRGGQLLGTGFPLGECFRFGNRPGVDRHDSALFILGPHNAAAEQQQQPPEATPP